MARKVGVDSLSSALGQILRQYGEEVDERLRSELQHAGEFAAVEVSRTSPRGASGQYAGSWDYIFKAKGGQLTAIVGNSGKHTTLSHLLEKGHMDRGGGWVGGREHIAPAYEKTVEMLDRRLHG